VTIATLKNPDPGFIVCRAPVDDTPDAELLDLYRGMSGRQLHTLRRALLMDRKTLKPAQSIAFCDRRVALIEDVLKDRAMGCPEYRPDHNGECLNCDEPAAAHQGGEGR
jgi:hypothetical protein